MMSLCEMNKGALKWTEERPQGLNMTQENYRQPKNAESRRDSLPQEEQNTVTQ